MTWRKEKEIGLAMQIFAKTPNIRFAMFAVSFGLQQKLFDAPGAILPMSGFTLLHMLKRSC